MSTTKDVPVQRSKSASGRNERFNNKAIGTIVRSFPASLRLRKTAKGSRDPTSFIRRSEATLAKRTSRAAILRGARDYRGRTPSCRVSVRNDRDLRAHIVYLISRSDVSWHCRKIPRNFSFNISRAKSAAHCAPRRAFSDVLSPVLQTSLQLLEDCRRRIVDRCRVRTGKTLVLEDRSDAGHGVNFSGTEH